MKKLAILIITLLAGIMLYGQITVQGTPPSFNNPQLQQDLPILVMPSFDIDAVIQAEEARQAQAQKTLPGRFGHKMEANITLQNSGLWENLPNGDRIWRMAIQSQQAFSLNLLWSDFFLPTGAELYLYNANKDYVFGAITAQNNKPHRQLSTSPIPGEVTILEYYEPANVAGQGSIVVGDVVHAYKDLFKLFKNLHTPSQRGYGDSGSCNIDVACPLGNNWQNQVKSVVIALINGNDWCTGTMVNNTLEDGTPYFLTANHCMINANLANVSFHFNFESPTCNGPTGSYTQSISGATLKASASSSDFALLELSNPPPPSFVVYYAGWDAAATVIDSTISIHHPRGDVKKISFNEDLLIDGLDNGSNYWRVTEWEMGTTENISSGSALFDKNGRIIGQLWGGEASCNNIDWDEYGKFSASWDLNTQPTAQLKAWLDPQNTGLTQLDGRYFLSFPNYDMTLAQVFDLSNTSPICTQDITPVIQLKNLGNSVATTLNIMYQYDNQAPQVYNWTGNLNLFQQENITLPTVTLGHGFHDFTAWVIYPNDINTNNDTIVVSQFEVVNGDNVQVQLLTDDYPNETSYHIIDGNGAIIYINNNILGQQTLLTEDFCLAQGCYKFVVEDSFGDGLFYEGIEGNFSVYHNSAQIGIISGNFGSSDTIDFCLTIDTDPLKLLNNLKTYPNPTTGLIQFDAPKMPQVIRIFDIIGRQIQHIITPNSNQLDLTDYNTGVYIVQFEFEEGMITHKIVKQ